MKPLTGCFGKNHIDGVMRSIMGNSVDFMQGRHEWHGISPSDDQLEKALTQLAITLGDY